MAEQGQFLSIDLVGWRDRRGKFAKLDDDARGEQRELAGDVGDLLVKELTKQSPRAKQHRKDTPRFADSWRSKVRHTAQGAALTVENIDPKRPFVLFPTKPHGIAARRAKWLRFESAGGSVVFRRRVLHPGTKGNPVLDRVMAGASGPIRRALSTRAAHVGQRITDIWR